MKAIVLAAGKGTRLQSEAYHLPKALRPLCGKPLISYVLESLNFIAPEDTLIIVGYQKEKVMEAVGGRYHFAEQTTLNGTAKATLCGEAFFGNYSGSILVCYCDMPFLRRETYQAMLQQHEATGAGNTLLTSKAHPIPPYGRLIRDASGRLLDVIEESACTEAQKKIDEVNVGIQVLKSPEMWSWLKQVDNQNPHKEYYLTGVARVLAKAQVTQSTLLLTDEKQMRGINTLEDLHAAEEIVNKMQT